MSARQFHPSHDDRLWSDRLGSTRGVHEVHLGRLAADRDALRQARVARSRSKARARARSRGTS